MNMDLTTKIESINHMIKNGDYNNVINVLKVLAQEYPTEGIIPYYLGHMCIFAKEEKLACKYFLTAINMNYITADLYLCLALLQKDFVSVSDAERSFIRALELSDTKELTWVCLSCLSVFYIENGKELLNKFLSAYTSIIYNDKYKNFISKTIIEGHTAPVAGSTYESGLPLSNERAENVKNYCLSSDSGVDTSKLSSALEAVGLSNSKPVYGSDGNVDMTASRRVSFRFVVNITK